MKKNLLASLAFLTIGAMPLSTNAVKPTELEKSTDPSNTLVSTRKKINKEYNQKGILTKDEKEKQTSVGLPSIISIIFDHLPFSSK